MGRRKSLHRRGGRAARFVAATLATLAGGADVARADDPGVLLLRGEHLRADLGEGDVDVFDADLDERGSVAVFVKPHRSRSLRLRAEILRPDGAVDGAEDAVRAGRKVALRRKGAAGGRWQFRVSSVDGGTGAYDLRVRLRQGTRSVMLPAGGFADVPFFAEGGAVARWSVKGRRAKHATILDASGAAVARRRARSATWRLPKGAGAEVYALRLTGTDTEADTDATVRLDVTSARRRPLQLAREPSVTGVTPSVVRQEDVARELVLAASGLLEGTVAEFGGDGVVARLELTDAGARLLVDVAADAEYGPRRLLLLPPPREAESIAIDAAVTVHAPDPTAEGAEPTVVRQLDAARELTLTGTGFREDGALAVPEGGGLTLGLTSVASPTAATAPLTVAEDAAVGPVPLTYAQPALGGGASVTRAAAFAVHYPVPYLSEHLPAVLRQEQSGVVVTLAGTHFRTGGTVSVSGNGVTVASPTWRSNTAFEATLSVAADADYGTRSVTYTHPADGGGESVTLDAALTIHAPDPTVTATAPSVVRQLATQTLTVDGTGFRPGGALSVSGGGLTVGATTIVSPTRATAQVTAAVDAAVGARAVTYTQPAAGGGAASTQASAFSVHYPVPSLTAVAPATLRQEQSGVVVTLSGEHFRAGGTVTVGGTGVTASAPTWRSNTSFEVTLAVAADAAYGTRPVTYTHPSDGGGDSATLAGALTIHAPDPTLASAAPAVVKQLDTQTLTVTGTGFRGGGTVTVSGTGLTLGATTIVSPTQATLQVTAAEDAAVGARSVTYTQPAAGGGAAATRASAFDVHYPTPTLTGVSTSTVLQEQSGVLLLLVGTNFRAGGTVAVSGTGVTASAPTWVSNTSFRVTLAVAADAPYGARTVTYSQPTGGGGAGAPLAAALTVRAPTPAITAVAPGVLKRGATRTLTVTGTGFRSGASLAASGSGLTLGTTTLASATEATVSVDVGTTATVGLRDVTFTQPAAGGGASATAEDAFRVVVPLFGIGFAPYEDGDDPAQGTQVGTTQIRARLAIVEGSTRWLRTFGSSGGLEEQAEIARELGLRTAVTAWLGRNATANAAEIDNLVDAALAGDVDLAIVGSEVLLRDDLDEEDLIAHIEEVREALDGLGIPVTTAETWDRLVAHPDVIDACDELMPNIYPYWEGIPIEDAVSVLHERYARVVAAAGTKKVWVSETGWPTGGDTVVDAVPSAANAARYFLEAVSWAESEGVDTFWFEALDQAWKADHGPPQEGHWGVWDADGALKSGMQDVFDGSRSEDTWTHVLVGGTGTPELTFTSVPALNSDADLRGSVAHVVPSQYRVAVYIRVNGGWWTKPTAAEPATSIRRSGNWRCDITTGGSDASADRISAWLVPASWSPPVVTGATSLPSSLASNAVASREQSR